MEFSVWTGGGETEDYRIELPMLDRLSRQARKTLALAREYALGESKMAISTVHLLRALIEVQGSAAHAVLREHSVDISVFKPQCNIERGGTNLNDCGSGCQDVSRWRGMSEEAASALKKAADLAEKLGKTEIGTAQVLAGLVACKGSEISTFLHDRGLTEDCEVCAASDPVGVPLSEVSRLGATVAIMHALSDLISHPQELAIMVVVTAQCKTELSITDAGGNHRIIIMIDSSGYIQVEVSTRDGHVFRVEDGWK